MSGCRLCRTAYADENEEKASSHPYLGAGPTGLPMLIMREKFLTPMSGCRPSRPPSPDIRQAREELGVGEADCEIGSMSLATLWENVNVSQKNGCSSLAHADCTSLPKLSETGSA